MTAPIRHLLAASDEMVRDAEVLCSIASAFSTDATDDARVIRDGEIVPFASELVRLRCQRMRQISHSLRNQAAIVKATAQRMENDPCSTEGRAAQAERRGGSRPPGTGITADAQSGSDSAGAGIKPGHGSNLDRAIAEVKAWHAYDDAAGEAGALAGGLASAEPAVSNAAGDACAEAHDLIGGRASAEPAAIPYWCNRCLRHVQSWNHICYTADPNKRHCNCPDCLAMYSIGPPTFPGYHVKPHDSATCPECIERRKRDDWPCTCGAGCSPGMCSDEREDREADEVEEP